MRRVTGNRRSMAFGGVGFGAVSPVRRCQKSARFERCVHKVERKNGWTKASGQKHRAYAICTAAVCAGFRR